MIVQADNSLLCIPLSVRKAATLAAHSYGGCSRFWRILTGNSRHKFSLWTLSNSSAYQPTDSGEMLRIAEDCKCWAKFYIRKWGDNKMHAAKLEARSCAEIWMSKYYMAFWNLKICKTSGRTAVSSISPVDFTLIFLLRAVLVTRTCLLATRWGSGIAQHPLMQPFRCEIPRPFWEIIDKKKESSIHHGLLYKAPEIPLQWFSRSISTPSLWSRPGSWII